MEKYNTFDRLLFLLIFSLISGYVGGIYTNINHILSFAYAPLILWNFSSIPVSIKRTFVVGLLVWVSFYGFSLIWTPDLSEGIRNFFLLLIHFIICLEILVLVKKGNRPIDSIINGWIIGFLFTSIIAFWEITSGQHLYNARETDEVIKNSMGVVFERHVAMVTFYNQNTYSTYMVMVLPFLFYKLFQNRDVWLSQIALGLIVSLILINSSRGAYLSLFLMFILYIWYNRKNSSKRSRYILITTIVGVFLLIGVWGDTLMSYFLFRMMGQGVVEDDSRMTLLTSSWNFFVESNGLGCGVGSMIPQMSTLGSTTHFITYSHNLIMELLLEGGIVSGGLFIYFLYALFRYTWRSKEHNTKFVIYSSLLAFPFYSTINSQYLRPTFVWCFFISLYVLVVPAYRIKR